jgi:Na+-transporting NADH:ubiquinone oxidoreductase subunit NqrE
VDAASPLPIRFSDTLPEEYYVTLHDALMTIRNQRLIMMAEASCLASFGAGLLRSLTDGPISETILYGAGAGVGTMVALTGIAAAGGWLATPPDDPPAPR